MLETSSRVDNPILQVTVDSGLVLFTLKHKQEWVQFTVKQWFEEPEHGVLQGIY